jgi:hypothetical protein
MKYKGARQEGTRRTCCVLRTKTKTTRDRECTVFISIAFCHRCAFCFEVARRMSNVVGSALHSVLPVDPSKFPDSLRFRPHGRLWILPATSLELPKRLCKYLAMVLHGRKQPLVIPPNIYGRTTVIRARPSHLSHLSLKSMRNLYLESVRIRFSNPCVVLDTPCGRNSSALYPVVGYVGDCAGRLGVSKGEK